MHRVSHSNVQLIDGMEPLAASIEIAQQKRETEAETGASRTAGSPRSIRRRRRPRPDNAAELLRAQQLCHFERQNHSLRVSASNVAAMAGLHPYKNLPELLLQLVYQGSTGQALLRADSQLLDLELISPDQVLRNLAQKAGSATQAALNVAFRVKSGTKVLSSVQDALRIKRAVIQTAKSVLNPVELKILTEGVRSAVDTGYGTSHEDDALDLFQEKCGWPVRERNAEIRMWPFGRSEDVQVQERPQKMLKTAVPLGKAVAIQTSNEPLVANIEAVDAESVKRSKRPETIGSSSDSADQVDVEVVTVDEETTPIKKETQKPYFCILGSVDGIRDELVPTGNSNEDDNWALQQVVVECKHRMNALCSMPPLYDQIQTTVYCLMYEVNDADIVQVLRRTDSTRTDKVSADEVLSLKNDKHDCSIEAMKDHAGERQQSKAIKPKPIVSFSRVSLDDPVMQHRASWANIVLPRLRSFVDAVYAIRCTPDKRYRLLMSSSDPDQGMEQGWLLMHEHCPWLQDCDTALHRRAF
jgi:hypothetical protein